MLILDEKTQKMLKSFDRLLQLAISDRCFSARGEPSRQIEAYRIRGEEIPDRLLPGRMVMRLSEEERKDLEDLNADIISQAGNALWRWGA